MKKIKSNKKYLLIYGHRRFIAFKKLGYKNIPCYFSDTEKTLQVSMKDIEFFENVRTDYNDGKITELMNSIKQHGLLEPIGIKELDKVETEDYIINNLVENEHRINPSTVEFAKGCRLLMEQGLNVEQVATRIGVSKSRIDVAISLYRSHLKPLFEESVFLEPQDRRKGKLAFSTVKAISESRLSNKNQISLGKVAKIEGLKIVDIRLMTNLINQGMSVKQATKERKNWRTVTPTIVVHRETIKRLTSISNDSAAGYIRKILLGEQKPDKNCFFNPKQ